MKRLIQALSLAMFVPFFMAGCSSMRLVDTNVVAFARWSAAPPAPGTAYRFERLPSQQSPDMEQDSLELQARSALAKVGMELKPAAARYSIQAMLNTQVLERLPYEGGYYGGFGFGAGLFSGGRHGGVGLGLGFPIGPAYLSPYYRREVTLLVRDLTTQQVVFETRALHEGVWSDTVNVIPPMLDAALNGFPEPPPGPRRINAEIPR